MAPLHREYLLESIVYPNKHIAAGFESLLVTMKDGAIYAGLLKSENDTELVPKGIRPLRAELRRRLEDLTTSISGGGTAARR